MGVSDIPHLFNPGLHQRNGDTGDRWLSSNPNHDDRHQPFVRDLYRISPERVSINSFTSMVSVLVRDGLSSPYSGSLYAV